MSQLDSVTQQNAAVAQQSSVAANDLNVRSDSLNGLAQDLTKVVTGMVMEQVDSEVVKKTNTTTKLAPKRDKRSKVAEPIKAKKVKAAAAKVIKMTPSGKATPASKTPAAPAPVKPKIEEDYSVDSDLQAVGHDTRVPSPDDARFKDV